MLPNHDHIRQERSPKHVFPKAEALGRGKGFVCFQTLQGSLVGKDEVRCIISWELALLALPPGTLCFCVSWPMVPQGKNELVQCGGMAINESGGLVFSPA